MANYHQTGFATLQALAEEKHKKNTACGCGRSLTGWCDGSHAMSEEQWQDKLQAMIREEKELKDELDDDDIDDEHNVSDQGG